MHQRIRTNGSRRRTQQPSQFMERWQSKGINIGSVNIRGLTFLKLFLLLEQEEVDVLCVQETWIAEGTPAPTMPGYQVVEQRRQTGAHGGLATYYRTSLKLESTTGNEYGLLTKLILPTSQRVNIMNVYMPPTSSLLRRGIAESQAKELLEEVLSRMQPQLTTMVCGDFNARVGSRIPLLDYAHPPRTVTDTHVCPRASWFIKMCEMHNLYILNGIHSPASYTCHTSRGESTVDYILCNKAVLQISHTPLRTSNITDHDLLTTYIPQTSDARTPLPSGKPTCGAATPSSSTEGPQAAQRVGHPRNTSPEDETDHSNNNKSYRWIEGECLLEYSKSATKWKQHTNTQEFTDAFLRTIHLTAEDNERQTANLETFLLDEAIAAGVIAVITRRTSRNPNKWAKHLAPWFNVKCKNARTRYREAIGHNGKYHAHT